MTKQTDGFLFDEWEPANDDDYSDVPYASAPEEHVGTWASAAAPCELKAGSEWLPCDQGVPFTVGLREPTAPRQKAAQSQDVCTRFTAVDGPKGTVTYVSPCRRYFVGTVNATRCESLRALLEELLKQWTLHELKPVPRPMEPMLRNPARWLAVRHSGRWDTLLGAMIGRRVATGGTAFPNLGLLPLLQPSATASGSLPIVRQLTLPMDVHYLGAPSIRAKLVKVECHADGTRLNCLFEVDDTDIARTANSEPKQQLAAEPLVRWMKARIIETIGQPMHMFFDPKKRLKPLDKLIVDLPNNADDADPVDLKSLSLAEAFSGGWFEEVLAEAKLRTTQAPRVSVSRKRSRGMEGGLPLTRYLGGISCGL